MAGCAPHPSEMTLPGQAAVGDDGYTAIATFDSVQNLVPNSTVQHDDVVVGTVTDIRVVNWKAHVTMRLKKSERIASNAAFTIGQKTLLGAQFVDIVDPAKPEGRLGDRDVVAQDSTGGYPQSEEILAAVSLLLNNGGLSQISTITGELNNTLSERVPDTRDLIDRLNELLSTLDRRKADIVTTLESLNSLSRHIVEDRKTVGAAIDTLGPGLQSLNEERDQLVDASASLGRFSLAANQLINTSQEALLSNLGSLRPILKELERSGDSVAKSLGLLITVPFPVETSDDAVKGDYANLFATVDVSLDSLSRAFLGTPGGNPSLQSTDPLGEPSGLGENLLEQLPSADPPNPRYNGPSAIPPERSESKPDRGEPGDDSCSMLEKLVGRCT